MLTDQKLVKQKAFKQSVQLEQLVLTRTRFSFIISFKVVLIKTEKLAYSNEVTVINQWEQKSLSFR